MQAGTGRPQLAGSQLEAVRCFECSAARSAWGNRPYRSAHLSLPRWLQTERRIVPLQQGRKKKSRFFSLHPTLVHTCPKKNKFASIALVFSQRYTFRHFLACCSSYLGHLQVLSYHPHIDDSKYNRRVIFREDKSQWVVDYNKELSKPGWPFYQWEPAFANTFKLDFTTFVFSNWLF